MLTIKKTIGYIISPYFYSTNITLGSITADDIQQFYKIQLEKVSPNTVIHYHAIIRVALCYAKKMNYICDNPIYDVQKPEANKFVGKYYSSTELNELIKASRDTELELPIIFGGFYGLRRSEVVGLRCSAIDFDNDVIYINHTVTTPVIDKEIKIIAKDRAKTESSVRALPLDSEL